MYGNLLYKMGQDFLDKQYEEIAFTLVGKIETPMSGLVIRFKNNCNFYLLVLFSLFVD